MPSLFTHPAVPLALGFGLGARRIPWRLLAVGCLLSMMPDLDVLGFRLGIPYASAFGHRGFSHSLLFALMLGAGVAWFAADWFKVGRLLAAVYLSLATVSHALLDACTQGGLGVALWWPWSDRRVFFEQWQAIRVSPIGMGFFSSQGLAVIQSELLTVWLPAALLCIVAFVVRMWRRRRTDS
jgi:inner membrane protein